MLEPCLLSYLRVQVRKEIGGNSGHQPVRLIVLQGAVIVLKNQAESDAFSTRFDSRPLIDVEDAKLAVDSGADALIVSNHGGRQLDGAESSIRALPAIVDAVGSKLEVHMDGGIRSGQDVLKAVALGARGTFIGRAFLYGLGAMGEAGVTKTLEIIHKELDLTMAFCGKTRIEQVDKSILLPGTFPT